MTSKVGTGEDFLAYFLISKEIQPNNPLKSTYNVKNYINNENDVSELSDTLMEVQPTQKQKMTTDNSDDGDGLKLNFETKMKLKSIEKDFDELQIKNEFITNEVLSYTDRNKFSNDQNSMIQTDLNKIKNDIDKLCNRKVSKEMENFQNFQILINKTTEIENRIGQFTSEMKTLKTIAKDACENKHIMKDMMKLLDYMKEQHCSQITDNRKYFDKRIDKYKYEIEELKAYANSKVEEVEKLEGRVISQEQYTNYCEDSIRKIKEFITDKVIDIHATNAMLSILIPYTTELEVTIANQKKVISQIAEKLEEMDTTTETEDVQEMIKSLEN